jgi:hypothetical protein
VEKGKWRIAVEGEYGEESEKTDLQIKFNRFLAALEKHYMVELENLEFIPDPPKNAPPLFWHPV